MSNHFDRQGNEIGLWQWAQLLEDPDYRQVGVAEIGRYVVSTVWLGLSYSFTGPPMIFETMVFRDGESVECERYTTEVAALAGHDQWVAWARES